MTATSTERRPEGDRRILVTGAGGFVGRALVRALTLARRPPYLYEGRINDARHLRRALQGVSVVYHLASAEARGRARLLQHVDVEGTERLLEESARAGVQHLVVMSRLRADPNAAYPLLRAKGQMERLVQRSGVGYTIVRSASLFGMEDRFLNNIAALAVWTWPFVWLPGGGAVALQPLWVQDLVRCLVEILDRPDLLDQTVVVAGEERLRYRELVEIVLRATGHRRIPLKVGIPLARVVRAAVVGWWRRPPVTGFFLDRFTVPDIAPLDSVLRTFSFRPERLADHISYLRGAGASLLFRRYP